MGTRDVSRCLTFGFSHLTTRSSVSLAVQFFCMTLPTVKRREFWSTCLSDFGTSSQTCNHKDCTINYGHAELVWDITHREKGPGPYCRIGREYSSLYCISVLCVV